MIEEFSFGNFWSFKDIQTLNLSAAKIKSKNPEIDITNVITINDKLSLLKSKAIYGANASGKSNVIKALIAFIRITNNSVKDEEVLSFIEPFQLSSETEKEPTFFQLIFRLEDVRYRYGFEADENEIKSEWLYATPNIREVPLFIRENNKIIESSEKHYLEGYKLISLFEKEEEFDNEIFRNNSLFLSTVASFGFGKLSKKLINFISSILIVNGLGDKDMFDIASLSLENSETKNYIINFLKYADVGIEDINNIKISKEDLPESISDDFKESFEHEKEKNFIVSKRIKYNNKKEKVGEYPFSFRLQESEGTKKMFELSPFIFRALKEGTPLIIDEFDARFHPLLTKKIVELFNSENNPKSQLVFVTHDTNLLSADLLRRDQIDFVEKDKYGASHLYTLVEFKGIRNTASFEKDYIQGKYGAIPFLGNFNKLFKMYENA